ncbi:CpXC motif protein OS=Ureibacillus acetophenoni OX=614649 GN=SAMN05877842_11177 PE=4 SV=1 [Ureibacillus acetophenoni]
MQNNENKLMKIQYEYDNQEYIIINKCPHCNLDIHPTVENRYNFENNTYKISTLSLSCPSCKRDYFIINHFDNVGAPNERFIMSIPKYSFNENALVKNTSQKFQQLYMQSINSELLGHLDLAFFGYVKSLEILIKEIAIFQHPESEDVILFSNLNTCLEQFHSTNMHLFSKKLLEILKNDYLYYYKTPDFHTSSELVKDCINYFLLYLEMLLKTYSLNNQAKTEKPLKS